MGSRNSMPASSAICASLRLFSHEASQRSGTLVTAIPPEQFGEKMPSLNLLALNIVVRGANCVPGMNSLIDETSVVSSERGLYAGESLETKGEFFPAGVQAKSLSLLRYRPAGLIASRRGSVI